MYLGNNFNDFQKFIRRNDGGYSACYSIWRFHTEIFSIEFVHIFKHNCLPIGELLFNHIQSKFINFNAMVDRYPRLLRMGDFGV